MDNVKITKNTYKQIYKSYSSTNLVLHEEVIEMLSRFISNLPGEKAVLDIGCAHGRESKYLHDHGCAVTGIDILDEFIELAKKNCPGCKFLTADMRNLPFTEKSFDGLWASASFLHIPKKEAGPTLNGFNRVLKPDGILYISVMEGSFDNVRPNETMKWGDRHFSDYQQSEFEKILKDEGFTVLEFSTVKTHWGVTFLHCICRKV